MCKYMKAVKTSTKYIFVHAHNVYSIVLMKEVLTSGLVTVNADVDL